MTYRGLDDIGSHFGIGGTTVCKKGKRVEQRLDKDKALVKSIKKIEGNLARFKV